MNKISSVLLLGLAGRLCLSTCSWCIWEKRTKSHLFLVAVLASGQPGNLILKNPEVSNNETQPSWNLICCGLGSWRNRSWATICFPMSTSFWFYWNNWRGTNRQFTANWKFPSASTLTASSCCPSATCGGCAWCWWRSLLCITSARAAIMKISLAMFATSCGIFGSLWFSVQQVSQTKPTHQEATLNPAV